LFNRGTTVKKSTFLLLALISTSASAQTVYDARRQLFGSLAESTCTLIGYSGQDALKEKNKGASAEQAKEKVTRAIQQKYQGNRDLMNMGWATTDQVYARPVKTWQEANEIGYEYCMHYMDSVSPY
jgi:hypothetical protein